MLLYSVATLHWRTLQQSKADDRKYAEIMEMRQSGKTWREIGEHFMVTDGAIRDFIKRYQKRENINEV